MVLTQETKHVALVTRRYTMEGVDPYDMVDWERRLVRITRPDGSVVFEQDDVEVPVPWSEQSAQILAQKYFRGALGSAERESSFKQVVDRVVGTIVREGASNGYFEDGGEAQVFQDELKYLLVTQRAAFNSPVWFNVGVKGRSQQVSACFLLDVEDEMESILHWYVEEGLIFRGGSGAGVNLSKIRGSKEGLSGGGHSSGPVSFMRGADASAGSIASGGATRRAAKMVILDVDHPDIEDFVWCKAKEEKKIRALLDAGFDMGVAGGDIFSVQYQNANNSVRVTDEFMEAVVDDRQWRLTARRDGKTMKAVRARALFHQICEAAWECADPGLLFDSTINKWHTLADTSRITSTNPCGEYHSVNNSACNLASINLLKFVDDQGVFSVEEFAHTCRVMFTAQEVLIAFGEYPTEKIAEGTRRYRQIGLGYANLGATLMAMGVPYDSNTGRAFAAATTALMSGTAYSQSSALAMRVGPFPGYEANASSMRRVLAMHASAAADDVQWRRRYVSLGAEGTVGRNVLALQAASEAAWDDALRGCDAYGVRNAQATVIAPTGTISFLMGCDTTSAEPAFALVSTKTLVGGGSMAMAVQTVGRALSVLGYTDDQRREIEQYVAEHGSVLGAPHLAPDHVPVFATAVGDNALSPMAHVLMVAAIQPFLSGAVSKTSNLPAEASVEDVETFMVEAWRLGVKALAIYRDGCKAYQPLQAKGTSKVVVTEAAPVAQRPAMREHLPRRRESATVAFDISGCEGYFTVGLYPDGRPGEVFIKVSKQGSTLSGIMDGLAISVSLGLQYGVPLAALVEKYANMAFEPRGITDDAEVRIAQSILDYIFRKLAIMFIDRSDREAMGILSNGERAQNQIPGLGEPAPARADTGAVKSAGARTSLHICFQCGNIMVPNGSCYACPSCGGTSGCS